MLQASYRGIFTIAKEYLYYDSHSKLKFISGTPFIQILYRIQFTMQHNIFILNLSIAPIRDKNRISAVFIGKLFLKGEASEIYFEYGERAKVPVL